MALQLGERVRITRGDMRGRIGVIRRGLEDSLRGGRTYGIQFLGETPLSNFRAGNLEAVGNQAPDPEFVIINNKVYQLTGNEPYELIPGGWMGKRRRYWWMEVEGNPHFTIRDADTEGYDFRRFPVENNGIVVTALWGRFQPHPDHIAYVLSIIDVPIQS